VERALGRVMTVSARSRSCYSPRSRSTSPTSSVTPDNPARKIPACATHRRPPPV